MISLVNKTFFITGLGSGIGYETGKLIKSLGGNLTGTIENEDQKKDVLALTEDVFLLDLNKVFLIYLFLIIDNVFDISQIYFLMICYDLCYFLIGDY